MHEAMLLEEILSKANLTAAFKQVIRNKGAGGIDGIEVTHFPAQLKAEWTHIKVQIETGRYQSQAVRRVEIPKPNGGKRLLGIPKLLSYYLITVGCRNVLL